MNTSLKGRDWLMTQDWSVDEIETALDTADQLKADFRNGVPTLEPRLKDIPIRIPQPQPDLPVSIYEIQKGMKCRAFEMLGTGGE